MQIVDDATVSLQASFDEAAVSPTNPLAYYVLEYIVGGGAPILGPHIPATPTGGEHVVTTVIVPAPVDALTSFVFDVYAVGGNGQKSPHSSSVPLVIDRTSPPAPTNFIIA